MSERIVLNFHGLGDPPADVGEDERPYWLSFNSFDALLDQVDSRGGEARFAFTFDDGNASDLEAANRLQRRGYAARFFVLAGRLEKPGLTTAADLKTLREMGMIVGVHGYDHVDWRTLDDAGLERETVDARRVLEEALGERVNEVAIPFGSYDRRVMHWLKRQDFGHIHTSDRGPLCNAEQRIWHRNSIRNDMGQGELEALLDGRWPLRQRMGRAVTQILKGSG